MYIIIPVIIITVIVTISFGSTYFQNVDLENTDASSISSTVVGLFDLNLKLGSKDQK